MAIDETQPHVVQVTIATAHDLTLRLENEKPKKQTEEQNADGPQTIFLFHVSRATLTGFHHFKSMLSKSFFEVTQDVVTLYDDQPAALKLLLQMLHGTHDKDARDVTLVTIWHLFQVALKREIPPEELVEIAGTAWFASWYARQNATGFRYDEYRMLLYPCYTFDHASGFAAATEFLAYNGHRHITERRPDDIENDKLRLHQGVIQQVNAAKGRLKTILHRDLYEPIDDLLKYATCPQKKAVLFDYEQALSRTGAWPVEKSFQSMSVRRMLTALGRFNGTNTHASNHCSDHRSSFLYKPTVDDAVRTTRIYFDGLCLDCMKKSKFGDKDADYWRHDKGDMTWDARCRIDHGQPTWYFSFMGRREKMLAWQGRKSKFWGSDDEP